MSLTFEWDETKASENLKKHKVSFEETQTVFANITACIFDDELHSTINETRELIIGHSLSNRILIVCFTERETKLIRIINARSATKNEIKIYEKENPFKE